MKVSPSLLAADFRSLASEIEMINSSEADYLHLDIMDGVFVPNISFGFPVIEAVASICRKPLDVHMMVVDPEKWIERVRKTGAYLMNVHFEACRHLDYTIRRIQSSGMKSGVTLNPSTPVSFLVDIIKEVDLVLLMSVNPGFGGQPFIENTLKKVTELKHLIEESGSRALIEVDGGVNEETGKKLAEAGADILVAGSYIFKADNPHKRILTLKQIDSLYV